MTTVLLHSDQIIEESSKVDKEYDEDRVKDIFKCDAILC